MSTGKRIFISAGELSGDYHAANLIKAVLKQAPETKFCGVGSHNMQAQGVELLYDSSNWGTIGIWQSVKKAYSINRVRKALIKILPTMDLDLIILIDYRVFHASILKAIREMKIRKMYYFAPVTWPGFGPHSIGKSYSDFLANLKNINPFFGKDTRSRFEALSELADKLIVAYPFALDDYLKAGADAEFLGHPLMNAVNTVKDRKQVRDELGIPEDGKLVGIFPGSRGHELTSHLPVLRSVIKVLKEKVKNITFYMPLAHPDHERIIKRILGEQVHDISYVSGRDYDIFAASDIALSKTGTSVQVLMALGVPTVAFYTLVSRLWYNISIRYFIKFDYIAFPNVMAGKQIIPEFIQNDFTPENLINTTIEILSNEKLKERISINLLNLRNELYRPDALERAASIALELAERRGKRMVK